MNKKVLLALSLLLSTPLVQADQAQAAEKVIQEAGKAAQTTSEAAKDLAETAKKAKLGELFKKFGVKAKEYAVKAKDKSIGAFKIVAEKATEAKCNFVHGRVWTATTNKFDAINQSIIDHPYRIRPTKIYLTPYYLEEKDQQDR